MVAPPRHARLSVLPALFCHVNGQLALQPHGAYLGEACSRECWVVPHCYPSAGIGRGGPCIPVTLVAFLLASDRSAAYTAITMEEERHTLTHACRYMHTHTYIYT